MSSGPLAGVTVIENASYISGPYAGLLLAQLGADVVKVEAPGSGDPFRRWGGAASGVRVRPQFAALNHGKRSVALDLRTPEGQAGYLDLAVHADALVENFRPGTLDRLGVGEAAVRDRNPEIVYCTVTGFGPTGPYKDRPAYDAIVQALSGLWGLLSPVSAPQATGPAISDTLSGLNTALAVVAGLAGTARHADAPRRFDVSMLAASLNLVGLSVANYAETGEVEGPFSRGRRSHSIALRCGDGRPLAVHLSSPEKFWVRLTDVVGRPDLRDDARFGTYPSRLAHFDELLGELETALADHDRNHWLKLLHDADVPAAPIYAVDEVVEDPHVLEAGLLRQVAGPAGERFLVPRGAIAYAGDLDACSMEVAALGGTVRGAT
ncbi:MAG: CoA transferase [Blastococcus sp.]|jgi:crotonobetainyl-CoA:carnitine CoA-transferase CaiB-like acyl-CoA transferase|nr:CoA transferase [Blastococcus sp.]